MFKSKTVYIDYRCRSKQMPKLDIESLQIKKVRQPITEDLLVILLIYLFLLFVIYVC